MWSRGQIEHSKQVGCGDGNVQPGMRQILDSVVQVVVDMHKVKLSKENTAKL